MMFFYISYGCTIVVRRRTKTIFLMFLTILCTKLVIKPVDSFHISSMHKIHNNYQNNNKYKSEVIVLHLAANNFSTTTAADEDIGVDNKVNSYSVSSNNDKIQQNSNNNHNTNYEYPWDDVHEWILKDNISRYMIQIPITTNIIRKYVLVRNLCQDIPELTGYPIDFLIKKIDDTQYIVPYYITQFQFDNNGGITGLASGIPGIEDGTRITTKPLQNVENTIPKRYVVTERLNDNNNNIILYELGTPLQAMNDDVYYSLDGGRTIKTTLSSVSNNILNSNIPQQTKDTILTILDTENNNNKDLLYIGGITAAVLGGAYVSQLLAHHLTINVFWV